MKYLLFIILLGSAVAVFFLFTQPELDTVSVLRVEESEIATSLAELQELARIRDGLLTQYNAINPLDLKRLDRIVPSSVDAGLLIAEMESFAQQNNLVLNNISVAEEGKEQDKKGRGVIQRSSIDSPFQKLPVQFQVSGNYNAFRDFLTRLETNTRIMDLNTIQFTSGTNDLFQFQVEANVYWIGEISI